MAKDWKCIEIQASVVLETVTLEKNNSVNSQTQRIFTNTRGAKLYILVARTIFVSLTKGFVIRHKLN